MRITDANTVSFTVLVFIFKTPFLSHAAEADVVADHKSKCITGFIKHTWLLSFTAGRQASSNSEFWRSTPCWPGWHCRSTCWGSRKFSDHIPGGWESSPSCETTPFLWFGRGFPLSALIIGPPPRKVKTLKPIGAIAKINAPKSAQKRGESQAFSPFSPRFLTMFGYVSSSARTLLRWVCVPK